MVRKERGLLRLLAKLGIKSAAELYRQTSILRTMDFKKLAEMAEDEPEVIGVGLEAF